MPKVIILGGGVAGLSAAHELASRDFIDVELYDSHRVWGGKARSTSLEGTGTDGRDDLPAEHGFRFFPGFYRHLSEIMAEIPINGGAGSVHDNLVSAEQVAIAQETEPPWRFNVNIPPDSLDKWVEALVTLFTADRLHLKPHEIGLFVSKVTCILGSCEARRREQYDKVGWWQFVDAAAQSDAYQKILARGLTLSLVAMRAVDASTYTIGNVLIQLLLDIINPDRDADRVLNGPTNDVWINPWIEHLEASGRVKVCNEASVQEILFDGTRISGVRIDKGGTVSTIGTADDWYLCALPVEVVQDLLSSSLKTAAGIISIDQLDTAWMNGVLFYLNRDIAMTGGHALYVDSPWALTSISQRQFWTKKPDQYGNGEVDDILSSIISEWNEPGNQVVAKKAWDTDDKAELMLEAWEQLKAHRKDAGNGALEDSDRVPAYVDEYVDEAITWISPGNLTNREPLLINKTESFEKRPQATTGVPNLLLASDYVQTHVNLATMEGAAEAARQAVNAILKAEGQANLCPIYPLQEPDFLEPIKAFDELVYTIDPDLEPPICATVDSLLTSMGFSPSPPPPPAASPPPWLVVVVAVAVLFGLWLLWTLL